MLRFIVKLRQMRTRYLVYKKSLKTISKIKYSLVDLVETIVVALIAALLIKQFILQVSVVPTGSMIPTLIGGVENTFNDRLLVNKFIYRFTSPKRGDIVVFSSPFDDGKDYVKRCVAIPGDTVEIKKGVVYLNGKELILAGVDIQKDSDDYGPTTLSEGAYFMLGDNRTRSLDSRFWGSVDEGDILGKALYVFWPFTRAKWLK